MTPKERFIAHVALLGVVMVGLVLVIPAVGELGFSDMLSERWQFRHLPIWLQIPFGIVVALCVLLDAWVTVRPPGKKATRYVKEAM